MPENISRRHRSFLQDRTNEGIQTVPYFFGTPATFSLPKAEIPAPPVFDRDADQFLIDPTLGLDGSRDIIPPEEAVDKYRAAAVVLAAVEYHRLIRDCTAIFDRQDCVGDLLFGLGVHPFTKQLFLFGRFPAAFFLCFPALFSIFVNECSAALS